MFIVPVDIAVSLKGAQKLAENKLTNGVYIASLIVCKVK